MFAAFSSWRTVSTCSLYGYFKGVIAVDVSGMILVIIMIPVFACWFYFYTSLSDTFLVGIFLREASTHIMFCTFIYDLHPPLFHFSHLGLAKAMVYPKFLVVSPLIMVMNSWMVLVGTTMEPMVEVFDCLGSHLFPLNLCSSQRSVSASRFTDFNGKISTILIKHIF